MGEKRSSTGYTPVPRFSQMKGKAFTPARADLFLEAIESGSEDAEAAEYAGITLNAVRTRRESDADFNQAYKVARANRKEVYRREARRRAITGWIEPVFYRGEQVGGKRMFSDRLLELLLKAEDPENFGDRHTVEVLVTPMTGADVAMARELGQMPGVTGALEQVAAAFAAVAERKALEAQNTVDGEYEEG